MSRVFFFLFVLFLLYFLSVSAHSGHDDDDSDSDADAGGGGDAAPDLRARPLILAKVWCLIVIFFATFVSGVSPYVLKWNEGFLVLGTQFAGGVFLGTAMMHFLSDANETFEDLTKKKYPFAFMLACGGYLLTMLADSVISSILVKVRRDQPGDVADVEVQGAETGKVRGNGVTFQSQHEGNAIADSTDHHLGSQALASARSLGDTILLIIALCAHSVFEGLAIGVAETKADAWKALWTICLHKIFAAIAMGIALLRMIPNRPLMSCAAYAFAFAISSPIGVAIGIILDATTQGSVADWIFAISMGLACGVFIYVSINHLLSKGYTPHKQTKVDSPYFKFLAVLLGVGVIAVVMIWDT
ncbi:zinc transporter 11 [Abrus precatorius]|uniref:Zinc transporter 11 n=1 Tax=Abrus precatorius TaxID=3816 RepID=A0A8B8K975_ABRPR|nr:zinc transporter 11 [Abrus precatorius]XP_027340294.1 zinc transporter 11 [Abrus precatorius]XP_027340295.1 zinc transporter 11 [Abrus precatorius]